MIQGLLAERFHLDEHAEKKEMPVYAPTLAKGGSKMKSAKDPDCCRPVLDQTGITGVMDLHTEWAPDGISNSGEGDQGRAAGDGLSIFTALQTQLGLKLLPEKGLVSVVVIDRAEKGSEN